MSRLFGVLRLPSPLVLAWLIEGGIIDVGHRAEGICSLLVPGLRTVQMK